MRTILFPTDGSEVSRNAMKQCMSFAKALGGRIIVLHVVPAFHMPMEEGLFVPTGVALRERADAEQKTRGAEGLAVIRDEAARAGIECETVVEISDTVSQEIVDTAERTGCDLIIMASHQHTGMTGFLLGSETAKVLTHTKLPVLVLH